MFDSTKRPRHPFNTAQSMYFMMGVDPTALLAYQRDKMPSYRKKGPGRKHLQGKPDTN